METKEGLAEVWSANQEVLIRTLPIYQKGNRIISLGRDMEYRRKGIVAAVEPGDTVLDMGCGPGTMSSVLLDSIKNVGYLVLADHLMPMLKTARSEIQDVSSRFVSGLFENLPFREGIFDIVMCGFSLRDAQNFRDAVKEIHRVLKNDGRLIIVDIAKPNNRIHSWFIGLYFRFIAGFLAFLFMGKKGFIFSKIYPTYRKHLRIDSFKSLLNERFEDVQIESRMLGAVMIVVARHPRSL